MNQVTKPDEWQGDCVITWQAQNSTIVLDFQDLRQKKQADLPGFVQSRDWNSSIAGTISALQEYLDALGFDTVSQGEDFTVLIKRNVEYVNFTVPRLIEEVANFLESHAGITVIRSNLSAQ